jgi:hypothetical protein
MLNLPTDFDVPTKIDVSTQSLGEIAHERFGDSTLWKDIADVNEEYNIFDPNTGEVTLDIPSSPKTLIKEAQSALPAELQKIGTYSHQVVDWIL